LAAAIPFLRLRKKEYVPPLLFYSGKTEKARKIRYEMELPAQKA
jgi:hypothetical protein